MINNVAYREWAIEHEYEILRQLHYLAPKCPHVTWNEAQKLYQLTIEKVKLILQVEHIVDAPFGRGLSMVKRIFIEEIQALELFRINSNKTDEEEEVVND